MEMDDHRILHHPDCNAAGETTMKRYLVFAHDSYYPSGGIGDAKFNTDDREELVEWFKKNQTAYDSIDVVDLTLELDNCDIWKEIRSEASA